MYAKLAWEKYTDEQIKDVMAFNEGYKNFITNGKTERLCVKQSIELAKEKGFKELSEYETLKPGDKVYVNNDEVVLTLKEFELLYYLLKNKNIVISRDKIMDEVWDYNYAAETRTVDVHIKTLRHKLGPASKLIETIRGVGYKIVD